MFRRRRRLGRVAGLAVLASGAGALVLGGACLPDLAAFPSWPEASVSTVAPSCGDGVIETLDDGGDAGESCDPGEAGAAGCESCRFTCSGGIDDAGHCYFFADPTSTYAEALSACKNASGHVVTFASDREVAFVSSLVKDAGYWVGLSVDLVVDSYRPPVGLNEPGWPRSGNSCPGCFAKGADDGGTFAIRPDVDASSELACLVAEQNTWLQAPCSGSRMYTTLCEREPIGQRIYPCGGLLCTTIPATVGSKRYVVWPVKETAEVASETCKTTYDGGSLVVFDSREEREQLVREIAQRLGQKQVWIGLSRTNGGSWTWDDGQDVLDAGTRPLPWANNQPNNGTGRAFLVIADDTFDTQLAQSDEDASSGERRVFVCQRPLE